MSNAELVKQAYDSFNRKDFDALASMIAPDCSWNVAGPTAIPWAGHYKGPEAVKDYARKLTGAVHFQSFDPKTVVEAGDTVVVCGSETAKVNSTGKDYTNLFAHVFTVKGGKITFFQEYGDTAEVERAVH